MRRLTEEQVEILKREYPACRRPEDRDRLARKLGLKSRRDLYDLACNYGLTDRRYKPFTDEEVLAYIKSRPPQGNGSDGAWQRSASDHTLGHLYVAPNVAQEVLERRSTPEDLKQHHVAHIAKYYGRKPAALIAQELGVSEVLVLWAARRLPEKAGKRVRLYRQRLPKNPLRRPSLGYQIHKVAAWLSLSEESIMELGKGRLLDIMTLPDRSGRTIDHWVLTKRLAAFVQEHRDRLLERGADPLFLDEVVSEVEALEKKSQPAPYCLFVDHGHQCRCPSTGPRWQTYCHHGRDYKCQWRHARFPLV